MAPGPKWIQQQCVSGLEQFSLGVQRKRGSSPKLVIWNNALINAVSVRSLSETLEDGPWWGRVVENAVGAYLLNHLQPSEWEITHWRKNDSEVDFVIRNGEKVWGLEVKTGIQNSKNNFPKFKLQYPNAAVVTVGGNGIELDLFFKTDPETFLGAYQQKG